MKRTTIVCAIVLLSGLVLGCNPEETKKRVVVEQVNAYKPALPQVPSIPKPTVPETYSDGTYSVYGLRKNIVKTIETEVTLTAYVVEVYQKPVCAEGQTCHVLMPHLWLADEQDEKLERRRIRLVGYAKSFKEMDDQKEKDEKGIKDEPLPDGVYLPPVIWDWREGHKYKITGRFTRQSGEGFMTTDGLMEYSSHECLDCPVEEEKKK
jgi:hypothetical protein